MEEDKADETLYHWWMWAWHKGWESYWALKALDDIQMDQLAALHAHRTVARKESLRS